MNQPSIIERYAQAERDYIEFNIYTMNDAHADQVVRSYDFGDGGRYVMTLKREQTPVQAQEPTNGGEE